MHPRGIVHKLQLGRSMSSEYRQNLRVHDMILRPQCSVQSQPRHIHCEAKIAIQELLEDDSTVILDEIADCLWEGFEIQISS